MSAEDQDRRYTASGASPEHIKTVLQEIAFQIKNYGRHIKAKDQAVGKITEGSYLADVSAATQGIDFTGQDKMPLGAEALDGHRIVSQVEQIALFEWERERAAGIKTPIDDMVEESFMESREENAAGVALFEARATSERSFVPDVWRTQLLGAQKDKPQEPVDESEEKKRKFLSWAGVD